MPLSCLGAWGRVMGQCEEEMKFAHLRYVFNLPVRLYAIERPFRVIFRSAHKCVVNAKHLETVKKNSKHNI